MKFNYKTKLTQLALATGLSLLLSTTIQAQNTAATAPNNAGKEVALTAVPPRLGDDYSLLVKPGQTVQAVIEVRNPSDFPATVETFARDFVIGADGETPIAVEGEDINPKWQLSQWLTLTPNNAVIKPRGTSTILVTINVPANALPGGRYAMVLHKPVTGDTAAKTTGAQINAQVGTLLYVVVDGPVTEQAQVKDFAFKNFNEMGPVPYSFKIANGSSIHIRPEAQIAIKNMFGKQLTTLAIDQKNIFPDSAREFTGEWKTRWGFGRYTADLVGAYGAAGNALTASTTFWIIPVRAILAVVLVIILVVIIVMTTRRKYSRMIELEEEKVRKLDEKLKKARRS